MDLASGILRRHKCDQHGYCADCLARWPCLQAQLGLELKDAYDVILITLAAEDPTPDGKFSEVQLALFDRVRDRVHTYRATQARSMIRRSVEAVVT